MASSNSTNRRGHSQKTGRESHAFKHGHTKRNGRGVICTPTYKSWKAMLGRCGNPDHPVYLNVTICEQWKGKNGFATFLADMGERPKGCTIDRFPNQQGNYEPGNCRWATSKQQGRNRINNTPVTFNGQTKCASEWAEELGITCTGLLWRLENLPIDVAMTRPVQKRNKTTKHAERNKLYHFNNQSKTLRQWAKELGKEYRFLWTRIVRGMSAEQAFTLSVNECRKLDCSKRKRDALGSFVSANSTINQKDIIAE